MALVVEDGTGLATADSYISVADAITYVNNYKGDSALWDGSTLSQKEVAGRVATQYLDGLYEWLGDIGSSTQALDWPRDNAYDELGAAYTLVPQQVIDATAEVMFLHITSVPLTVNAGATKEVQSQSLDGVGAQSFFESKQTQPSFPIVSRILSGLYESGGRVDRS